VRRLKEPPPPWQPGMPEDRAIHPDEMLRPSGEPLD
jgi:hypothetical protein